MKMAVSSVIQGGIGVGSRPGTGTRKSPWGVCTVRSSGAVTTSRPERISAGTCT